jgi:8-oxo-dGTP pyrophosphatase MutT (NUDIX family)
MEGLTRPEIDKAESRDFALGGKPMRPRDAATLILIDRSGGGFKVLIGRRHARHAFMPGKFVFPGGRTDRADGRVATAGDLHPLELAKLVANGSRLTPQRARSIALSAVRETYEEAGLLIGRKGDFSAKSDDWSGFADHGVQPSLEGLRFVARAITPPGRVRRFDTRFFAARREDVAAILPDGGPTNELEELVWLRLDEAKRADIPTITRTILESLEQRLSDDPDLAPGGPVPFYRLVGNRFRRDML